MRTKPILHHDTVFIMIMMTLICPHIPQASGTRKKKYACFKIIAINCSSDMECTSDADRKNDVKQTTHFGKEMSSYELLHVKCQI